MTKIQKNENKNSSAEQKRDVKFLKFLLIAIVILVAGYFILSSLLEKPVVPDKNIQKKMETKQEKPEPPFKKQGELEFLKAGSKKVISKIDIEIAENDSARMMGLMFRKSMEENRGMVFIFDKADIQSFWMKNTIIPLDLIYVSDKMEIVTIIKNAKPFSLESRPSTKPAQYVVEVNGGYTDKLGINTGDYIKFQKIEEVK